MKHLLRFIVGICTISTVMLFALGAYEYGLLYFLLIAVWVIIIAAASYVIGAVLLEASEALRDNRKVSKPNVFVNDRLEPVSQPVVYRCHEI